MPNTQSALGIDNKGEKMAGYGPGHGSRGPHQRCNGVLIYGACGSLLLVPTPKPKTGHLAQPEF
ncbi:hypothetical protein N7513_000192 [Penicillium frequentans]|nr:hypothetical protein N7513_000192 [Penicillium glabrum]